MKFILAFFILPDDKKRPKMKNGKMKFILPFHFTIFHLPIRHTLVLAFFVTG